MQLVEYNSYIADERNAASKAKQDVSLILHWLGFKKLYNPSKNRFVRILQQLYSLVFMKESTLLFIQYPSNIPFFYRILRHKKKIMTIVVIHDLEFLRDRREKKTELDIFNGFDFIISHNSNMTKFLSDNGVIKPIYNLMIFDYLLNGNIQINPIFGKKTVFFAGNLSKSSFLRRLYMISDTNFNLYGASFDGIKAIESQQNVCYRGSYSPEQLISNIEGGWGLVWDGDMLETCSGLTGEYLRFNNPHKVSMCIVSERPIIIWKESAMADYIVTNNLGIVIDSLLELSSVLSVISESNYLKMVDNVKKEKAKLVQGLSLRSVLKKIANQNDLTIA